jgi:hypothetical protein
MVYIGLRGWVDEGCVGQVRVFKPDTWWGLRMDLRMAIENPDIVAIETFLCSFFYKRHERFTNFTATDKWPARVLVDPTDPVWLSGRYVGSLYLSVSALVPAGLIRFPGAAYLVIIAYRPSHDDGQISDPEEPGRVMLYGRRTSQFRYDDEIYRQEFRTLTSLEALLEGVLGADEVDVEYKRKEDAIVNGIRGSVMPLIVGQFAANDVTWMRANGKLKQLVLKLRGEINSQVESALDRLGIAPADMKSVFTVPNTLERIDFVMSRISD